MMAHLVASGLSWAPFGGARILHGVSFVVPQGQVLAICGANGAGKSTLLRMLHRHLRPDAGQVLLGGPTFGRCRRVPLPDGSPPFCGNNQPVSP